LAFSALPNSILVRGHVDEGHAGFAEDVRDVADDGVAQLAFELLRTAIALDGARQRGVEGLGVGQVEGVDAEGTQPHHAEILVADRDRIRRAPLAVDLLARGKKVDVGLEGRLEQLVPVLQVGQYRQGLRGQLVHAGAEDVGHRAFIDEHRHLRFAHRQAGAVLDFHFGHGKAPGHGVAVILGPLDDVDELFLDEIHECHVRLLVIFQ
jgi:hypothetical protein